MVGPVMVDATANQRCTRPHRLGRQVRKRRRPWRSKTALVLAVASVVLMVVVWCSLFVRVLRHSNIDLGEILGYKGYSLQFLPSESRWAIFYHIFLPPKRRRPRALQIVQEQLEQVSRSINQLYNKFPITLYYTTIGDTPLYLREASLKDCRLNSGLDCRPRQHLSQGDEVLTLQSVYEFCQQAEPDQIVTYLHSKGSYHSHKTNERWRPHLTKAALHSDCISSTKNGTCNVCGLHFYYQWTSFFPGNMFTARCDYIRQLIPPNQFPTRQEQAVADLLWMRHRGVLSSRLFDDRIDFFGLDRYAMEHWVGSHPDLKPCDIANTPFAEFMRDGLTDANYSWARAPRHEGPPASFPSQNAKEFLQQNVEERLKELFYLPGRLRLWTALYQRVPPRNSWVWNFFPDGSYFRDQLAQKGWLSSVEYGLQNGDDFLLPTENLPQSKLASPAVFFGPGASERSKDAEFFLSILGLGKNWEAHTDQFVRITLKTVNDTREGEALQRIYDFCRGDFSTPTHIVMYVGTVDAEEAKQFSKCIDALKDRNVNVCGSKLLTGGVLHFEGRNWAAKCSYVRKLVSPNDYVVSMNRVSARAWVESLKDRLKNVPQSSKCLSADAYALQSWITSHPDVAPNRVPAEPVGSISCPIMINLTDNDPENIRLRSYALLAGHLFRWNLVYGKSPAPTSWVWNFFSDGKFWRDATQKYGIERVVESVTQPMARTRV